MPENDDALQDARDCLVDWLTQSGEGPSNMLALGAIAYALIAVAERLDRLADQREVDYQKLYGT